MSKDFLISVDDEGSLQFIHDDELTDILRGMKGSQATIKRASNVEPSGTDWYASMTFGDGEVLGPFAHRQSALQAEVKYLEERLGEL